MALRNTKELLRAQLPCHSQGDWRGISRHHVPTRTPTQVASHAQKYYIRQLNLHNRKRRSSLFDMAPEADGVRGRAPRPPANVHLSL